MPMYALGVVLQINTLSDEFVKQVWYADDAIACGCLADVQLVESSCFIYTAYHKIKITCSVSKGINSTVHFGGWSLFF